MASIAPGLDGYLATRQLQSQEDAQKVGILSRLVQLKQQQDAAARQARLDPLQIEALQSQIAERKARVAAVQQQQQALGLLSRLQSPEGSYQGPTAPGVLSSVAGNDQDALRQVVEAEAQGRPMAVNVPNQANVRTLASLAFPKEYGKAFAGSLFPKPDKPITPRQNIVPVTGGYLQPDANGQMQFVRTQNPGAGRESSAPVAVIGTDGKPVFVSRSDAVGRTPANLDPNAQRDLAGAKIGGRELAQREAAFPDARKQVAIVTENVESLKSQIRALKDHPGLSGITGAVFGRTPSVTEPSMAAQAIYDNVVNNIFVNALQSMRAASKTGGAVGNVSDKEGTRLEQTLAALNRAQGTKDFQNQLKIAIDRLEIAEKNIKRAFDDTYAYKGGSQNAAAQPGQPQSILDQADAIINGKP